MSRPSPVPAGGGHRNPETASSKRSGVPLSALKRKALLRHAFFHGPGIDTPDLLWYFEKYASGLRGSFHGTVVSFFEAARAVDQTGIGVHVLSPRPSEPALTPETPMRKLSHVDERGSARMVDVSAKKISRRTAIASALVRMRADTLERIRQGNMPKGEVLNTARIAGILAAKRVDQTIPLTHSLPLDHVEIDFSFLQQGIRIEARASVRARTGVEMEALTAAAVAALTVYDMAKALDREMTITDLRLDYKSGGTSGTWAREKRR